MRNYEHIETNKYGKTYRIGYGANGENYQIVKLKKEFYASCVNPHVPILQYNKYAKTLREINDWLGGLKNESCA